MSYTGNTGSGWSNGEPHYRLHAFDPYLEPELFCGVLTRGAIAFIIDLPMCGMP